MPAILTHKAIMLLARERVQDIRDRLILKKADGLTLTDLELRVLRLATLTHIAMSDSDDSREKIETPSEADWPDGFGVGVSRFSVMGSMGPDIPGLAALLAPAQEVWFDTVHKGTPDANREQINARTTDLALEIWKQGSHALSDRPTGGVEAAKALDRARSQLRAYVLGHLCHIVGDVIAHPFVHDVEWHVPSREPSKQFAKFPLETVKFSHQKTEGSLDTRVAIEMFLRTGPRDGQEWSAWWPTVDEVPPELFVGYAKAFDETYKALLNRPKGLANFEHEIQSFTPQIPDADYFRDGYRSLTHAGVGLLYHWGYGHWLAFLSLAVIPAIATFPLAFAMPKGKEWFEKGADNADERATFETLTLPFAMNAFTPIAFGALVASITSRGSEGITTAGLISSAFGGLSSLLYFITVPAGLDPGAPWRWILLFGVPAAVGLATSIAALVKTAQDENRRKSLLILYALPFIIAAIVGVLLFVFTQIIGGEAGEISWGVLSGLIVVVGLILLFFVLPQKLRDTRLPEEAGAFPARRPHDVRLFDKSSLFDRPQQNDESKTETHFPSAVRPLLRLWWTGPGDFFIRPRRTHIEYVFAQDGQAAKIVPAPITPMSERQLAEYLQHAVRDAAGQAGGFNCALVFEADANVELPPGATFADHGDTTQDAVDDAPESELAKAAAEFRQLSRENNSDSYVLFHAPKRAQAIRVDRLGVVPFEERENEGTVGAGTISGSGIKISGIGTAFRFFLQPGDRIVFNGQPRIVTKIESDNSLVISSSFNPAPDAGPYQRLGSADEQSRGYSFIAQPKRRAGTGDTIMDIAGDIAAVLCLGGTSRMSDSIEAHVADLDGMVDATNLPLVTRDIQPIQRVFRNWCLDRRLVDEWRELVLGGATTSATAAADTGARVLLQQGWIQTLRGWLRVVDVHTGERRRCRAPRRRSEWTDQSRAVAGDRVAARHAVAGRPAQGALMADRDGSKRDDPRARANVGPALFGKTPTTQEVITDASRQHASAAPVDPQASGWLPIGPRNVGGAVRCIAQNPTRPTELLAGSAQGGLWKTVDDGYSWRPVAEATLFGGVGSVAYAPSDPRTVYVGSGELPYYYPGGIGFFKSTDGGETFTRLVDGNGTLPGSAAHYGRIVVDPADDKRAWIASNTGLWRLEGNTFTAEALGAPATGNAITDVALTTDPANANQYRILAGVATVGVALGIFDRSKKTTTWTVTGPGAPAPWAGGIGSVRVAWSSTAVTLLGFAVMEDTNAAAVVSNATNPTFVFNSLDSGATWNPPPLALLPAEHVSNPLYAGGGVSFYGLALAVNPNNASHVLMGSLDVHSSTTGGAFWIEILDSNLYDNGDRAQHADQSSIIFDVRGGNAIWVGNDGGISFCADCTTTPVVHVPRPGYAGATPPTPKPLWRKRSFGLSAAQLMDITTHPRFPVIYGGGMQDNGTFISYGGPTWYAIDTADGGAVGFHPTSPFRFYTSWQSSSDRIDVSQFPPVPPPPPPVLPPLNAVALPEIAAPSNVLSPNNTAMVGVTADPTTAFFIRALEAHPTQPDFVLLGAFGAGQYATDMVNYATANLPGLIGNITSAAFPTIGADMWFGSDAGEVFFNAAALPASNSGAAQPAWTLLANLPGPIAAIAIHPTNSAVVAVATALGAAPPPGNLFLSHDRGAHFTSIGGGATNALPPSPYLALAFDPGNVGTLFVGTAAGVYVARDLPGFPMPPSPAPITQPTWRTFNLGLPAVPITDLSASLVTNALRCGTFGRGAFECALTSTPAAFAIPAVSLLVRNHAHDDGRTYPALNTLGGDVRIGTTAAPPTPPAAQPAATANPAGPIDVTHSPDIRVDSPRLQRFEAFAFGEAIDGAEFDENLVRDEPLVGDTNTVYVQVQNRGTDPANNVDVHLYFADAGNPPVPPAIPVDLGFPLAPPAASLWQRASDPITVGVIQPGQPVVVTFSWIPPLAIRDNVALLAVVTNGQDNLATLPAGLVAALVTGERRAALHITHVQRDTIFIRDGLDDSGERGAVPWGGRSPDISVRQAQVPAANLAAEFADLAASHAEDRAKTGQNFVYVRVSNRTATVIPQSTVRLFMVPRTAITAPGAGGASWTTVAPAAGVVLNNIPANGSLVAEFGFALPADPDPDGSADGKGIILLAMANTADAAGTELDPFPDLGDINDVASFWRFFTGAQLGNNAAMRALRFVP